jgi:hypothetical protein
MANFKRCVDCGELINERKRECRFCNAAQPPLCWLLRADPDNEFKLGGKLYSILTVIRDSQVRDHWPVNRSDVQRGDKLVIWCGKGKATHGRRGVIAFAEATSNPNSERRVYLKYEPLSRPLWDDVARNARVFKTLTVMASQQGLGPYHVTEQQYEAIRGLAANLDDLAKSVKAAIKAEDIERGVGLEGHLKKALVNRYERDPRLRLEAIRLHGVECSGCGFNFEDVYGRHGRDYIHVHHVKPLSMYGGGRLVNVKKDMAVVCANCHAMIHKDPNAPLSIAALKKLVQEHRR